MKPETVFRKKVRDDLKELDRLYGPLFFEPIQQKSIQGSPDFVLCVRGCFVALELKATSKDLPTRLQTEKLLAVAGAGGLGIVAYPGNWDEVRKLLIHLLTENENQKGELH